MGVSAASTPGLISMTYFTFYSKKHPRDLCREFWRDPHATIAARGRGGNTYRQHHFDPERASIWPSIDGVDQTMTSGWTPDGCDELIMDDPTLMTAGELDLFMSDESNFLECGLLYVAPKGQYKWHRADPVRSTKDCKMAGERVFVFLRRRPKVNQTAFADFIRSELVPALMSCGQFTEVKSYIFAPFDSKSWPSTGVDHEHPKEEQYHGALLLGYDDELSLQKVFQSDDFKSSVTRQKKFFEAIYSVGIEDSYQMVEEGTPTLLGLRGYTCARIISQIGAANQTQDPILSDVVTRP